jgi:hypothetical protein
MYMVHTRDADTDLYALFRLSALRRVKRRNNLESDSSPNTLRIVERNLRLTIVGPETPSGLCMYVQGYYGVPVHAPIMGLLTPPCEIPRQRVEVK